KAFAGNALESLGLPHSIIEAQLFTMVIAEIKLRGIAMKVKRAHMLINAIDTALEDTEKALCRVSVNLTPHIFASVMLHHLMLRKFLAQGYILPCIIGHKVSVFTDLLFKDRFQGIGGHAGDVKRSHFAVSLNKRENGVFVPDATALLGPRLPSDKGFVCFNRPVIAKHPGILRLHGFTNPMRHKPSGFIGHTQGAMKLMA